MDVEGSEEWIWEARSALDFERSSEQSWERTSTAFMVVVLVVLVEEVCGWGLEVVRGSSSAEEEVGEGGAWRVVGMVFWGRARVVGAVRAGVGFGLRDTGAFGGLVVCEVGC